MKLSKTLTTAVIAVSMSAFASSGTWINQTVRAGYGGTVFTGKIVRSQGCLYVKFDRPATGGIVLARIADAIDSIELRVATQWVAQDLSVIRKSEHANCFAAANG
jgi:uncharacterized protein (DUF697 family)